MSISYAFSNVNRLLSIPKCPLIVHFRNGIGQDFFDPTGKFQNLCRLTGRSTVFFTEGFYSLFNASKEKNSKGGPMVEVLKFVTRSRGLKKKAQKFF